MQSFFALNYRMKFKSDVFIDLLGYRKWQATKETSPDHTAKLYKNISKHLNCRDIYAKKLIEEGIIEKTHIKSLEKEYKEFLKKILKTQEK